MVMMEARRKEIEMAEAIQGVVRIGNGTKLHPAVKDPVYGVIIRCSCPGAKQGGAYHRARFFTGMVANCRA